MKTKSFKKYIEKRLDKDEIRELEQQAEREVRILDFLRRIIFEALNI